MKPDHDNRYMSIIALDEIYYHTVERFPFEIV